MPGSHNGSSRTVHMTLLFSAPGFLDASGFDRFREEPSSPADPKQALSLAFSPGSLPLRRSVDRSIARRGATGDPRGPQVYAIIRGLVPSSPDDTRLRVFVNCDYLSQAVPVSDPHYVATVGFFGAGAHEGENPSVLVNLTPALTRLAGVQRLDADRVVVQLLPTAEVGGSEAGLVSVGEIEVVIV